jgi:3'(2'), 5'-bisphosphate nucleotidase
MASRSYNAGEKFDAFLLNFKINKIVKRGSSLKLCAIAAGKADIYPRFGLTSEWDTAAGHAILRAAGGEIVDFTGKPLRYGGRDGGFLNPEFCAVSGDITTEALQI